MTREQVKQDKLNKKIYNQKEKEKPGKGSTRTKAQKGLAFGQDSRD